VAPVPVTESCEAISTSASRSTSSAPAYSSVAASFGSPTVKRVATAGTTDGSHPRSAREPGGGPVAITDRGGYSSAGSVSDAPDEPSIDRPGPLLPRRLRRLVLGTRGAAVGVPAAAALAASSRI